MRAERQIAHRLVNGEELLYSQPDKPLADYLERVGRAMEDPNVSEQELLALIYSADNPLLDSATVPGLGIVTRRTIDDPVYRVMVGCLSRKRVQMGTLDLAATEAGYTVSVTDAASILNIHPSAVRQAIQIGRLSAWRKGGHFYLRPESLESYDVGRRGPRSARLEGGGVLRIRCGHAKGIRFAINIAERMQGEIAGVVSGHEFDRRFINPDARTQRQRLMAEEPPESGVVEGLLPAGWLRIGVLTNAKEGGGQRFFVLEPDTEHSRLEFSDFFVAGKFRIVEKENNSRKANQANKAFQPRWA